jgi:hypothetical protein
MGLPELHVSVWDNLLNGGLTQQVPPVDPEDLKKCWELRRELGAGSISVELFRQICKPETDPFAAGFRASMLLALLPLISPEQLVNGEPSDALVEEFARIPFEGSKKDDGGIIRLSSEAQMSTVAMSEDERKA